MIAFPNAKINIGLNIVSKAADGYHNLETIFYPIKINDAVEISDATENTFVVKGLEIDSSTGKNLCERAYELIANDFKIPSQQITLLKEIPIGAGLGGGSSDAAAVIKLLNKRFNLGISVEAMEQYARKLGADCAFFIQNKPVYATGRGDQFESITLDLNSYFLVLVNPPIHISTVEAYAGVKARKSDKVLTEAIQQPVENWKESVENDFELSVFKKHPSIGLLKDSLYKQGAVFAQMSGSGSSVYGIFKKPLQLEVPSNEYKVYYNL